MHPFVELKIILVYLYVNYAQICSSAYGIWEVFFVIKLLLIRYILPIQLKYNALMKTKTIPNS